MSGDKQAAPIRAGLLWHSSNSGNLGVGALTLGNMALAREAAARAGRAIRFTVLGFVDPGREHYVSGADVRIVPLNGRAMLPGGAFDQAIGDCDCALDIGGGDSWADIYGRKRFFYLWWSKMRCISAGVPLILSPQTIGPFAGTMPRRLARTAMNRARAVVARDPRSFQAARETAPQAEVTQATDVAFALPFDARDHGAGIHVGLNVSGLLYNGGYSGANEFGMEIDYRAFTHALIEGLIARGDARVHLVCHVDSEAVPQDDDARVARKLKDRYSEIIVAPRFAGPVAAKSYIAGLDLLVGGRMHACIAAHSAGVAVVPVAYSRKFSGLFEGVLDYQHLIPVTGMATDEAVAFALRALDRREELRSAIEASRPQVKMLLERYTAQLTELFTDLARTSPAS